MTNQQIVKANRKTGYTGMKKVQRQACRRTLNLAQRKKGEQKKGEGQKSRKKTRGKYKKVGETTVPNVNNDK